MNEIIEALENRNGKLAAQKLEIYLDENASEFIKENNYHLLFIEKIKEKFYFNNLSFC